jgi:putative endonuclease
VSREQVKKNRETWWLYMLACADGSLYTGIARDVGRRMKQHEAGVASRYTRGRGPVVLIHKEECCGHSAALKKEAKIKKLTKQGKEEYVRKNGPREG